MNLLPIAAFFAVAAPVTVTVTTVDGFSSILVLKTTRSTSSSTSLYNYPDVSSDPFSSSDTASSSSSDSSQSTPSWRHALLSDMDLMAIENVAEYCLDIDEALDIHSTTSVYTAPECDLEQHQALVNRLKDQREVLLRHQAQHMFEGPETPTGSINDMATTDIQHHLEYIDDVLHRLEGHMSDNDNIQRPML
mmetsp:Transcript_34545/g.83392  ORF Transcript_34545/g.83392 Transcript_34545/m.83392 type:complete len:192 (-) Transcript_34545:2260-2835(-)|eukprot:CAMPEP_0113463114 /NCGR_PEP_ID=MMETSP0014_2-20120614/12468_1 /TAXON_ID=2857 /ORGANISM="Nitzschia sp." /LENGTH=191 /DNA_ID=CAMNT_0000355053 /DNA_START=374 /DNA_END=949 /DNA_ORIENTATION=- /assembly_acc=CAM_ASM_000159